MGGCFLMFMKNHPYHININMYEKSPLKSIYTPTGAIPIDSPTVSMLRQNKNKVGGVSQD